VATSEALDTLSTEDINPRTTDIDQLSTLEMLRRINEEDVLVPKAVAHELEIVAAVVDQVVAALQAGGRLIYVGSGTSGRLGVLDAAECPPTYGSPPWQIQAVLAGGADAMTRAVENAEDDEAAAERAMDALQLGRQDVVLGIASSGRTPFVTGALARARACGATTVALVANAAGPVAEVADWVIAPRTGPEVIAGSTRMKAGTAQKLVLNMISTAAMVRLGHTYGNLMVDMHPRNDKLRLRSRRIVMQATGCDQQTASATLEAATGEIKTAIVMLLAEIAPAEARARLARAHGMVRQALADRGSGSI
jgi:N-acetylmuramic acid 6-phosphate etherase